MRRTSVTVSGNIQAPTTASVAIAVTSSTVMNRYMPNAIAAAMPNWSVARAACRTVLPMPIRLGHRTGRATRHGVSH